MTRPDSLNGLWQAIGLRLKRELRFKRGLIRQALRRSIQAALVVITVGVNLCALFSYSSACAEALLTNSSAQAEALLTNSSAQAEALLTNSSAQAEALPNRISFQLLLDNKDIVLGEVSAFLQDKQGFMWICGRGGLIRFDSYEFKVILQTVHRENELGVMVPEKIAVKSVNHIFQDSDNILWVATRTGLLRYDPRTETLAPLVDVANSPSISSAYVNHSLELPSGELLVSSGVGVFVLDRHNLQYTMLGSDIDRGGAFNGGLVRVASWDGQGSLLLGTKAGLVKMNWASKTSELIKPFPERLDLPDANSVNDFVLDRDGAIWLGTTDGLVRFNPVTLERKRYVNDPSDPRSISATEIAKLMQDSQGALWIASDGGGVSIFERTEAFPDGIFTNHKFEVGRASSLSSNQVRTLYEDRAGDVWVGNYPGGINYFDRSSAAVTSYIKEQSDPNSLSHSLSHSSVLAVRADAKQNLWLGTDGGGLNYFDRQAGRFTSYQKDLANPKSLSGNAVLDVFIADDGKIWAGIWGGGISILDPVSGEIERLPFNVSPPKKTAVSTSQQMHTNTVWSIKQDSDKNLWLGTHAGGLSKLDRGTGIYTHYVNINDDPTSISAGVVWDTLEDSNGTFWVGTANGLDVLDRKTGKFTHFKADPKNPTMLASLSAMNLFEDSKRRLWVGTEVGLHLLNADQKTFKRYNKASGLLDDTIRTILEAPDGQLWISTNNGISILNPETGKIKNYNRDSGRLLGVFHVDSGLISDHGEMIFGGVEGLRIFNSARFKENAVPPPIAFTDLKIFADTISVGDVDGILPQSLNFSSALVFDYQKSMFQVGFAALNFRDTAKNRYAYRLDGFDKDWLQVGDQRSARYTNLNPGTYVFRVKASNNDGVWNEKGIALTIVQLPPPWRTWWAYTLYGLLGVALIVWFVSSQRKKRRLIEQQNRLLELKVAERTIELREKNNDIKAMLINMRQGLFTIEASGNIHPEYSHFLEEIFETKNLAGKDALKLLFDSANVGSNALNQVKETVYAVIGENEINYEFNSHLLIEEYDADFGGSRKFLSLDWNPIVVDDVVVKLMVSVRDVTLIKKMEDEAKSKKRELDIVSQLLNVSAKKYLSFATSTKRFLAENRLQIERNAERSDPLIAMLFRNLHTIKGNCRTFKFDHFSNVVHDVESTYTALRKDPQMIWVREQLLSDIGRVEEMLNEYEHVYYTVLGRADANARDLNGFWADSIDIQAIQSLCDAASRLPSTNDMLPIKPVQTLLARALSVPLHEVLADVVESLPSVAILLGKEAPSVVIDENHVRIKASEFELVSNIFTHILCNAVDHGIETPQARIDAGKPTKGVIKVTAEVDDEFLNIHICDDGQGINIDELFNRGMDIGRWKKGDTPSYLDIANLIFVSGVTTKAEVTYFSGRGVGLEAVKEFLATQGGHIKLLLLGENATGTVIGRGIKVPFELVVVLPESAFSVYCPI